MLINCPECNEKVSDKALCCIHCGYPLNNNKNQDNKENWIINVDGEKYDVSIIKNDLKNMEYLKARMTMYNMFKCSFIDMEKILEYYFINKSMPESINHIDDLDKKETFKRLNNLREFQNKQKESYNIKFQPNIPTCPKCGSTAITAGQRGYALMSGFLGSNKTVNRCANCGHTWKPGK